ncbi:MAG: hypothetical protein IT445_01200 [Phycisphaeraceae bacterium]|nr:hypothetical protein [Phycisphaeraceae bacterium]
MRSTVRRAGGTQQVKPEELSIGEIVLVKPGTRLPVDGEVVGSHPAVDQSSIDDRVIVPLGVLLVRWMIPAEILVECRKRASPGVTISTAWMWTGAIIIGMLWFACLAMLLVWGMRRFGG